MCINSKIQKTNYKQISNSKTQIRNINCDGFHTIESAVDFKSQSTSGQERDHRRGEVKIGLDHWSLNFGYCLLFVICFLVLLIFHLE